MMIINDDRVCPKCGGYSQGEGSGYCTNGHFVKEEDWTTAKVDKKIEHVKKGLVPEAILQRYDFEILSVAQTIGMYYNKYSDAEECALVNIKCHSIKEGNFFINMYYGIGYRSSETKTVSTINKESCDAPEQYGNKTDDNPYFKALDDEMHQNHLYVEFEEDSCYVFNQAWELEKIQYIVVEEKIDRKTPKIAQIMRLEAQLAEAKSLYKETPEYIRHYERDYVVTAKFPSDEVDEANRYMESKKGTEGVIAEKGGYVYISNKDDMGVPASKMMFQAVDEGLEKIKNDYAVRSDVVSGEYADWLYSNKEREFAASIPLPIVMGAIQAFRAWDHEKTDGKHDKSHLVGDFEEVQCEVKMEWVEDSFGDEGGYWDNEFQDYMFDNRSFVPEGTRVGVICDGRLILDEGIHFASDARRGEDGNE